MTLHRVEAVQFFLEGAVVAIILVQEHVPQLVSMPAMCCVRLQAPQLPLARSPVQARQSPTPFPALVHGQAHLCSGDPWQLKLSIRPNPQGSAGLQGNVVRNSRSNYGSSKEPSSGQQQQRKSLLSVCGVMMATCFRLRYGQQCNIVSLPTSASAVLLRLPS